MLKIFLLLWIFKRIYVVYISILRVNLSITSLGRLNVCVCVQVVFECVKAERVCIAYSIEFIFGLLAGLHCT